MVWPFAPSSVSSAGRSPRVLKTFAHRRGFGSRISAQGSVARARESGVAVKLLCVVPEYPPHTGGGMLRYYRTLLPGARTPRSRGPRRRRRAVFSSVPDVRARWGRRGVRRARAYRSAGAPLRAPGPGPASQTVSRRGLGGVGARRGAIPLRPGGASGLGPPLRAVDHGGDEARPCRSRCTAARGRSISTTPCLARKACCCACWRRRCSPAPTPSSPPSARTRTRGSASLVGASASFRRRFARSPCRPR